MEYPVEIEGFNEKKVALRTATLLAGPVLTVNGEPATKGPGKNQYRLTGDKGEEVTVEKEMERYKKDCRFFAELRKNVKIRFMTLMMPDWQERKNRLEETVRPHYDGIR